MNDAALPGSASALRAAFDRSFAEAPREDVGEVEGVLCIRVGGDGYALRVREITELVRGRRVVALPARVQEFLGLAGIRGGIVPVYSLGSLLGYSAAPDEARWLALCNAGNPIGLAFSEFEGYLPLARRDLCAPRDADGTARHVTAVTRAGTATRGVISVPSVIEAIRKKHRCAEQGTER